MRKSAFRSPAYAAFERIWALGLRVARSGWMGSTPLRRWTPGGGRILVVAPHPDDETIGVGGAIALHREAGDPVTVGVVTDGRRSRAGGLPPSEMAERRRREVTAALRELRVDPPVWLGFAEGRWDQTEARPSLEGLIARADVVYAPSVVDFHPEHRRVARLVASLVQPSQQVRVYEIGVPLTPLLVNLIADIQTVHLRKARALAHFASQSGALEPIERLARYRRSLYGLDRSEVFWELPAEAYARVTRLATRVDTSTFWGIRRRPVTDPLAFLVGTRARKELRSLAQ